MWGLWLGGLLGFVALHYAGLGPFGFQKGDDGRMSASALLLFGPYLIGAWLNSRWWTRRRSQADAAAEGVWLGRYPARSDFARLGLRSWLDLCAELPARPGSAAYRLVLLLDLVVPSAAELERAAAARGELARERPTLGSCALGYSRSALVVAAWRVAPGLSEGSEHALAQVERSRPGAVLSERQRVRLHAWRAARSA